MGTTRFGLKRPRAITYRMSPMTGDPSFRGSGRGGSQLRRLALLLFLALQILPTTLSATLPKRLILALDGISFRDMQALQQGVTYTDAKGREFHRQAFNHGYFPASRMISTFPSTSDVAWTDMFGDRPLPGYQRTYYCQAANSQLAINGVTTTMEHERQMTYELHNGLLRTMGYVFPRLTFKYELHDLMRALENPQCAGENFYAYIRTTDDSQHLSADILAMLCALDEQLEAFRARYRSQVGRELEILIMSDHGNNQAGPPKRVPVRSFLKKAGYRITKSLQEPKDVVLPTAGIESWIELHTVPSETERLAELLTHLEGAEIITAHLPGQDNRFLVLNAKGERAHIDHNTANDSYRYVMESGDPLSYGRVMKALERKGQLDAGGFAASDAWMALTVTHRYPLALERIARAHTRVTLNPATILVSLDNRYAHADWLIMKGSERVRFGGTHGSLDDINSTGMLVSNFAPTRDTSTSRIAALYDGFKGLRDYRAQENGAELIDRKGQALTAIARSPVDSGCRLLPSDAVYLRVWSPAFAQAGAGAQVELAIKPRARHPAPKVRRGESRSGDVLEQRVGLAQPIEFGDNSPCERVYPLPPDLVFEPGKEYRISGQVSEAGVDPKIFDFAFRTDSRARPIAY
jgi:hypothetical protein